MSSQNESPPQKELSTPLECAYYTVRPNRNTLTNSKIHSWVTAQLPTNATVLYACCGMTELDHDGEVVSVDIDEETPADIHADIRDLAEVLERNQFDACVFDPPFSQGEADRTYNGITPGYGSDVSEVFDELLVDGGRVVQIGFHTRAMPPADGYARQSLAYFNLLGRQKDWFGVTDVHTGTPQSPSSNEQETPVSVPINAGSGTRTDVGNTTSLTMRYRTLDILPDTILGDSRVVAEVAEHASGRVLDTHAAMQSGNTADVMRSEPDVSQVFLNHGDDRGATLQAFGNNDHTRLFIPDRERVTRVTAQSLDEYYNVPIDTVVFAPAETAFNRTVNEGRQGADTAAKDAFHKLVRPGGTVIQVAPARGTCMPGRLGYDREHVTVFATPGSHDAIVVTVDRRPIDDTADTQYSYRPHYVPCVHCGEGLPASPTVCPVSCPVCNATPDEYCKADTQHGYHTERVNAVNEANPLSESCPGRPGAQTHEIASEDQIALLPTSL